MIHVLGLDSDKTAVHFHAHARRIGIATEFVNLREIVDNGSWSVVIPDNGASRLVSSKSVVSLDPNASYYCRIMDLSSVQADLKKAAKWRGLVSALNSWLENIPGPVINRPGVHSDNFTKPLHEATLGSFGFKVPLSFTSSDPDKLRRFAGESPTIVKPVSGVLSTTRLVSGDDFANFNPKQGPVHLQRYISGADLRVHVVGNHVFAEQILASGVDYRRLGASNRYSQGGLPHELRDKIVSTTKIFGLTFMGWDFKIDSSQTYWCLEANPMPGYNFYDERADFSITKALIAELLGLADVDNPVNSKPERSSC